LAETTHLLGLPRKHRPKDIKPQGAGSDLNADKVDGLHAAELGGGGPHAASHETSGGDKVHIADIEHSVADATLHDAVTSTPHISQADKDKIHDRLHALDSALDHSGEITDAQHGTKTTIPNAHHAKVHGDAEHTPTYEKTANKGIAGGYCDLDASVLVPLARIPATLTGKDADKLDGKHLSEIGHQVQTAIQGSDVGTTSTYFVDIPNMTITLSTKANNVLIIFSCTAYFESLGNFACSRLLIDGQPPDAGSSGLGIKGKFGAPAASGDLQTGCLDFITMKTLAEGSHTFKVQWRTDAGATLWCRAATGYEHMVLVVMELKN